MRCSEACISRDNMSGMWWPFDRLRCFCERLEKKKLIYQTWKNNFLKLARSGLILSFEKKRKVKKICVDRILSSEVVFKHRIDQGTNISGATPNRTTCQNFDLKNFRTFDFEDLKFLEKSQLFQNFITCQKSASGSKYFLG